MEWSEVGAKDPILLNLGGAEFHHPVPGYEGYVSVDLDPPDTVWSVRHDLTTPIPLPDATVSRIHTEDFLEHISVDGIDFVLAECYRLLVPGGMMRIGVPDYNNPKDRPYLEAGVDPRYPGHVTLTHYELFKEIVERSPFDGYRFYHHWDGDSFVSEPIDYSLGMIQRTPDHHPKCRTSGVGQKVKTAVRDFFFLLARRFDVPEHEMQSRKGHRLHITSLTVDLYKF
jgi:predicted SAM-dependent methyltransferase